MHLYPNCRGRYFESPPSHGGNHNGMMRWQARPPLPPPHPTIAASFYRLPPLPKFSPAPPNDTIGRLIFHNDAQTPVGGGNHSVPPPVTTGQMINGGAAGNHGGNQSESPLPWYPMGPMPGGGPFRLPAPSPHTIQQVPPVTTRSPPVPVDYSRPPPPLFPFSASLLHGTDVKLSPATTESHHSPSTLLPPLAVTEDGKIGGLKMEDWQFLRSLVDWAAELERARPASPQREAIPADPRLRRRQTEREKPVERTRRWDRPPAPAVLIDASLAGSRSPPFWTRYLSPCGVGYTESTRFPADVTESDPRFAAFLSRKKAQTLEIVNDGASLGGQKRSAPEEDEEEGLVSSGDGSAAKISKIWITW